MVKLADKSKCTGCSVCSSVCPRNCIEMKEDKDGFCFPELIQNNECIECHLCENTCPVLNTGDLVEEKTTVYAALSCHDELRALSSSGGIMSELALQILHTNGLVFGAAFDDDFLVRHIGIDNEKDLKKIVGAKYLQSDISDIYEKIKSALNKNIEVMFCGTPCQVAGLRSYLGKNYENLLCVDFICHGIPSPSAWKSYMKYRGECEANGEKVIAINMRSKSTGWSHYNYSSEFTYRDGRKTVSLSGENIYMKLFAGDYINRECCQQCNFKGWNRISDITLGDFWGIWNIDTSMDDNKGTSLILVHSNKGKKFLEKISEEIKIKEVDFNAALVENAMILCSAVPNENRDRVLELIRNNLWNEVEKIVLNSSKGTVDQNENEQQFIKKLKNWLLRKITFYKQ